MYFPTHKQYRDLYYCQTFSLPGSIIYFITKNPSSPKGYQRLINCCKYFFIQKPILILHCLSYDKNEWTTCFNSINCSELCEVTKIFPLNKISSKIWVLHHLKVFLDTQTIASNLIQRFYKCDAIYVALSGHVMFFKELLFYLNNAKGCMLKNNKIFYDNRVEVPCDVIVANLPRVITFSYEFNENTVKYLSKTQKELHKIPHYKNIKFFELGNVNESFDIHMFYECMKQNRQTKFCIFFTGPLSNEYKLRLERIVDELLATKKFHFFPAFFSYPGQNVIKRARLNWLFKKIKKSEN